MDERIVTICVGAWLEFHEYDSRKSERTGQRKTYSIETADTILGRELGFYDDMSLDPDAKSTYLAYEREIRKRAKAMLPPKYRHYGGGRLARPKPVRQMIERWEAQHVG